MELNKLLFYFNKGTSNTHFNIKWVVAYLAPCLEFYLWQTWTEAVYVLLNEFHLKDIQPSR